MRLIDDFFIFFSLVRQMDGIFIGKRVEKKRRKKRVIFVLLRQEQRSFNEKYFQFGDRIQTG